MHNVTCDFGRGCTTPILVMPDDTQPHPYAVASDAARPRHRERKVHFGRSF